MLDKKSISGACLGITLTLLSIAIHAQTEGVHAERAAGAQLQLKKLIASEVSISEASQSYFKSFFQQRGLYLTVALGVVLCILLLIGIVWTLRQTLPRYLHQIQIFLTEATDPHR